MILTLQGEILASAGDDGIVILWVPTDHHNASTYGSEKLEDKESWRAKHMCRSTGSEIYDLAWSPDALFVIVGSMDNVATIYNAQTGKELRPCFSILANFPCRSPGTTDCGAQSLCARCSVGPFE